MLSSLCPSLLSFNLNAHPATRPDASVMRHARLTMAAALTKADPLPFVELENAGGDTAKIFPFGACVTSYVKDGHDALRVRPDAAMDGSKPISGGIPFCFPQFGPGKIQQHGFARNVDWTIAELKDGAEPSVKFTLCDSDYTREMWPHAFECEYTVTLAADRLATDFRVKNVGDAPFDFTAALHSYFACEGIREVEIKGAFDGATFLDKMQSPPAETKFAGDVLKIEGETDSVFKGVSGEVELRDCGGGRKLGICSEGGWADTVVWNPFGNEGMGYDGFVCVESAKALEAVTLQPGAEWDATMALSPSAL